VRVGWLVSVLILVLSIPAIYLLSIKFFASLFNENVDATLLTRAVAGLYIAHIVATLLLTVPEMSLENRLVSSLIYAFLCFFIATFLALGPLGPFRESPTTWMLVFLSLTVLTGSVALGHEVNEYLWLWEVKVSQTIKPREVRIGKDSYIVVEGGRKLVKKCFKGLSSNVFEDVVGGVSNWVLLGGVSGVPKLVRFDVESMCVFVEYVEGRNLREFIAERGGRLGEDEAACVALGVAKVLKGAWESRGVVHRDLKPENIIVSEGGRIWVIDWEYSIKEGAKPRAWVGTLQYAPRDGVVGGKYDVYSLGIVLQEAITGSSDPRASLALKNLELKELIERMRKENPEDRVDIGSVVEALSRICRPVKKEAGKPRGAQA